MFVDHVHNLNPVIWRLSESIQLRWYGLAYLFGFIAGYLLLRHLARRRLWVLKPSQAGDFIAASALFGVFLGGRLGYLFLYQLPANGWGSLVDDPLMVLRVWEGGMASHGGILGLVIFTWFYARKQHVTWTGLGDGLCVVAPVGLFFGRLANFINGELYGRVADHTPWAVKFPLSLQKQPIEIQSAAWQECSRIEPKLIESQSIHDLVSAVRENPEVAKTLGQFLDPRHPSQLYEAGLEGVLLFAILWTVRVKLPKAPDGLLTGMFFALYAVLRILGEAFREPDADLVGSLSKGQFFSLFMLIFAAGFFAHAWRVRQRKPAS